MKTRYCLTAIVTAIVLGFGIGTAAAAQIGIDVNCTMKPGGSEETSIRGGVGSGAFPGAHPGHDPDAGVFAGVGHFSTLPADWRVGGVDLEFEISS